MSPKIVWFWSSAVVALVVLTIAGTVLALSRYARASEIDINVAQEMHAERLIFITGNVTMPGLYPFTATDTITDLLGAAGGFAGDGDIEMSLDVAPAGTQREAQKIDINRAEVWLLQALPGIGETLAGRIVDYREQNGPFRNIADLARVAGIGSNALDRLSGLITVGDR